MSYFNNFIDSLQLVDLPLAGGKYTWFRHHESITFCRLNRFLLSVEVLENIVNVFQNVLPRSMSDHNLIVLCQESFNWGLKLFCFFNYWVKDGGFGEFVKNCWGKLEGVFDPSIDIWMRLRKLKPKLKQWQNSLGRMDSFKIT
ncbi:hypothetical protein REPUB_Repub06bG0182500 [Reevesia pubescens]